MSALLVIALLLPAAEGNAAGAQAIAEKGESHYRGFGGQRIDGKVVATDPSGAQRTFGITFMAIEVGGASRSLIRFTSPDDIAGTALLTVEVPNGEDEQWLYLPRTGDMKKISGASRSNSFLGTDLTFEDLSFPRSSRAVHALAGDGTADGKPCTQVEAKPRGRDAIYARTLTCYDKQTGVPLRVEYYDRAGVLLKVMTNSKFEDRGGKLRPMQVQVDDKRVKRSTVLNVTDMKVGLKLSEQLFTQAQLRTAAPGEKR